MCDVDQNGNLDVVTRIVVRWRRERKEGGVDRWGLLVMLLWLP
jgi:hypothetical protein